MNTTTTNELREFHRFVADKLSNGGADLSPEEALDEWRDLHPDLQTFEDDTAAITEALDDLAKGDKGMPFEEFDRTFRQEHNLPAKP